MTKQTMRGTRKKRLSTKKANVRGVKQPITETIPSLPSINLAVELKKPRLLALLFCDYGNIAKDDKVNLVGVFDRIFVHPKTKKTPPFNLFIRTAETVKGQVLVSLYKPDNSVGSVLHFGGQVGQQYAAKMPAQIQLLVGIQFTADIEGNYWFDVSYRGKSLGGAGLVIEYRETEGQHGGTDTFI